MKYFIDTEFIERGPKHPVELVSIAIVSEDDREFYAVSSEFNARHASQWVKDNVLVHLPYRSRSQLDSPRLKMESSRWMTRERIAEKIIRFIGNDPAPEFWGWCCGFDYVLFSQLIGFDAWPSQWPYYMRDLQQVADERGVKLAGADGNDVHDALADARFMRNLAVALDLILTEAVAA